MSGPLPRALALRLALLLLSSGALAFAAGAREAPDLAELEAGYEAAFAAALEMSDEGEPVYILQAWGSVMMTATVLERARAAAEGRDLSPAESLAVTDRVLERWQEERPAAGGPELMRAFRIEDPAEKQAAIIALADRYPDDALVIWQASNALRQAGEVERAAELAEAFEARNSQDEAAYRILAQAGRDNQTQLADVLERWARAAPGDGAMVRTWMGSTLPDQEPQATERMLAEFFASRPSGREGLSACLEVLRRGEEWSVEPARACVARIAADSETPASEAQRAQEALAKIAAEDGDWTAMLEALEDLEPQARGRAPIAAARGLEAPERCGEAIELLSAAADAPADQASDYQVASALRSCSDEPQARGLFGRLLLRARASAAPRIVGAWAVRVNGVYRGPLPEGTAELLERRLLEEPGAEGLFKALDVVYQLEDRTDQRFDLLQRWRRQAPESMRAEHSTDLAQGLLLRGQPESAIELLEGHLESHFAPQVAETLWQLYIETSGLDTAERLAADLVGMSDRWAERTGHLLVARGAALGGDLAAAEAAYWRALAGEHPSQEVAVELLSTVARSGGQTALERTAQRICAETDLARETDVTRCAAELLTQAGNTEGAAALLVAQSAELPEDLGSLRKLAATARNAGQSQVAEQALRRILELDPRDEASWVNLGVFLEKQGRVEEVEALLEGSRSRFSPPPTFLYRAVGRALTAGDRPRRAIDLLLEARAGLPDTKGGEWSRGWIDQELRQAYRALGRGPGAGASRAAPQAGDAEVFGSGASLASLRAGAEAGDARSMVELARRILSPTAAAELCTEGLGWLERATESGSAEAAALLGKLQFYGRGDCVPRSPESARRRLQQAVESHQPGASYDLAMAMLLGDNDGEDRDRGLALLEGVAAEPDVLAVETLALLHATGIAAARDPAKSRRLMAEAARLGSDGLLHLRRQISVSEVYWQLFAESVERLEELAVRDDPAAMAFLARLYSLGVGGEIDPGRLLGLAQRAAAAGEPTAMRVLSGAYRHGRGTEVDLAEALRWQRRCAEAGDTFCMMFLGNELLQGDERQPDRQAGVSWLRRAAEAGNWWAIADLGRLYDEGRYGLARDAGESAAWRRRLADLDDPEAIGWLLYHGYR